MRARLAADSFPDSGGTSNRVFDNTADDYYP